MGSVNLVVVVESLTGLAKHDSKDGDTTKLFVPALVAVGAALGVKFMLFLYCFSLRKANSQVRVLWEDHRNDLWINGFGLLMAAGGSKIVWCMSCILIPIKPC